MWGQVRDSGKINVGRSIPHQITRCLLSLLTALALVSQVLGEPVEAGMSPSEIDAIRQAINDSGATWTASENHITRLSSEERRAMLGGISDELKGYRPASRPPASLADLPVTFSWGNEAGYNWMTPVKNQGICGSCGAFAAAGMFEARERIRVGQPNLYVDVSEQSLVSCCPGCMGSTLEMTLDHFTSQGCPDEVCFPYVAANCDAVPCEDRCVDWAQRLYNTNGNGRWNQPDISAIKSEIMANGPVATPMTLYSDFYSYSSGIYQHVWGGMEGGHFVVLYGWNDNSNYWLAKNSWGADWGAIGPDGQYGWFRIKMGTNEADCEDLIYYVDPQGHDYPQVVATVPEKNDPACPSAADISITFDADLDPATISVATVFVYGDLSGVHSALINYDIPSRTVMLEPDAEFLAGEQVSVVMSPTITTNGGMWLSTGYSFGYTTAVAAGGGTFSAATDYSDGAGTRDLATGDFSNDGHPDLASTDAVNDNLSVRLGLGDGTFGAPVSYPVGSVPTSVAVSDFNGDGDLDLAVVNSQSNSVSVLFNSGDGSFVLDDNYFSPPGVTDIVAFDIDADGDRDLVSVRQAGTALISYSNDGTGSFGSLVFRPLISAPYSMTVGDLDDDGDFDIGYADYSRDLLIILWNDGPGTFGSQSIISVGAGPRGVACADLNRDTRLDPVVANSSAQSVSVLIYGGEGSYDQSEISTAPLSPESVCVADLNGDSYLDIVAFGFTGMVALRNQGDGTFAPPVPLAAGGYAQGLAADFNGDAKLDLAAVSYTGQSISVLVNNACVDSDGDGFGDPDQPGSLCSVDNCPSDYNEAQIDADGDGFGDVCDRCAGYDDSLDADSDAVPDDCDNCADVDNPGQNDADTDNVGDVCDICAGYDDHLDADNDAVPDGCDNCPTVYNPDQEDSNGNDLGDACETCCEGRVGDANGLGGDEPTIGDVSVMIDAKFITGTCEGILGCFTEADVNQSGGLGATCDDITIGDISTLIDYLFITGKPLGLADCL